MFVTEKFLKHLDDSIKKNIILYDVVNKKRNIKNNKNDTSNVKIYRHYINYEKLYKDISLFHPNERSLCKDYQYKHKLDKTCILKERKEFLEKIKKPKNHSLFLISCDKVYMDITENLNPLYKKLFNLGFEAYMIKDTEKAYNIFQDLLRLIKSKNDNKDIILNEKIKGWIDLINNCK